MQPFIGQPFDYTRVQIMKVFRSVRDDIRAKFTAHYRDTIAKNGQA